METLIIRGYPGVGKSYVGKKYGATVSTNYIVGD